MRRYRVEVGGRTHVIDVQQVSATQFQVTVEGRPIEVRLSAAEAVSEGAVSPEVVPSSPQPAPSAGRRNPPSAAHFKPPAADTLPAMVPAAPPALPPQPDRSAGPVLKAPMPGTITAVEVKPGEAVATGQVVLRLEAMKMVNAIKAPRNGVVAEVHVRPGESVGYGHPLLTFAEV
jgi:biotin carboxyl carrier protein